MTGCQGLKGKSLVRDDFKDAHNKNQDIDKRGAVTEREPASCKAAVAHKGKNISWTYYRRA